MHFWIEEVNLSVFSKSKVSWENFPWSIKTDNSAAHRYALDNLCIMHPSSITLGSTVVKDFIYLCQFVHSQSNVLIQFFFFGPGFGCCCIKWMFIMRAWPEKRQRSLFVCMHSTDSVCADLSVLVLSCEMQKPSKSQLRGLLSFIHVYLLNLRSCIHFW